jgi:hypothetical protein
MSFQTIYSTNYGQTKWPITAGIQKLCLFDILISAQSLSIIGIKVYKKSLFPYVVKSNLHFLPFGHIVQEIPNVCPCNTKDYQI